MMCAIMQSHSARAGQQQDISKEGTMHADLLERTNKDVRVQLSPNEQERTAKTTRAHQCLKSFQETTTVHKCLKSLEETTAAHKCLKSLEDFSPKLAPRLVHPSSKFA